VIVGAENAQELNEGRPEQEGDTALVTASDETSIRVEHPIFQALLRLCQRGIRPLAKIVLNSEHPTVFHSTPAKFGEFTSG